MKGGTRSYEMASRLVRSGHDVHMITTDRNSDSLSQGWKQEIVDGIHVHWYQEPYSNAFGFIKRMKAFLQFAIVARKKAVQLRGDLIFATSTPLTIAIPGVYASKKLSVPLVFEVRDLWPELPIAIGTIRNPVLKFLSRQLERYAYTNSTKIIALSPGMAQGIMKTGYSQEDIAVIPNLANTEMFTADEEARRNFLDEHPYLENKKIILYAGTIGKINGIVYLAEIAAKMLALDPSIVFLIVGEGSETQRLLKAAHNLKVLNTNLFHLSRLPKADMPAIFAIAKMGSSIFIDLPEMWPNSANKFFDALAAGKPVLINYQGWQADEIRGTDAGLIIPPNNPMEAAERIHAFLANDELVKVASRAAFRLAQEKYEVNILFEKFRRTLESAGKQH